MELIQRFFGENVRTAHELRLLLLRAIKEQKAAAAAALALASSAPYGSTPGWAAGGSGSFQISVGGSGTTVTPVAAGPGGFASLAIGGNAITTGGVQGQGAAAAHNRPGASKARPATATGASSWGDGGAGMGAAPMHINGRPSTAAAASRPLSYGEHAGGAEIGMPRAQTPNELLSVLEASDRRRARLERAARGEQRAAGAGGSSAPDPIPEYAGGAGARLGTTEASSTSSLNLNARAVAAAAGIAGAHAAGHFAVRPASPRSWKVAGPQGRPASAIAALGSSAPFSLRPPLTGARPKSQGPAAGTSALTTGMGLKMISKLGMPAAPWEVVAGAEEFVGPISKGRITTGIAFGRRVGAAPRKK
jgi:hypothetical protein